MRIVPEVVTRSLQAAVDSGKFVTRLVDEAHEIRAAEIEASDDRTIEVTWATETEVRQWFGREQLVVSRKAVDLTRMNENRAPVYLNHSRREQVGVVENVRFKGNTLVGDLRFSRGALGEEIYNDVLDGIRSQVSCGYRVLKYEEDLTNEKDPLLKVVRWQPFEVSIVGTGADQNAIVNRSTRPDYFTPEDVEGYEAQRSEGEPEAEPEGDDMETAKEIMKAARAANQTELGMKAIEDGWTLEEFNRALEAISLTATAEPEGEPEGEGESQRSDDSSEEGDDDDDPDDDRTEEERNEAHRSQTIFTIAQENDKMEEGFEAIRNNESIEDFTKRILKDNEQVNGADPDNPYTSDRPTYEKKDLQKFRISNLVYQALYPGQRRGGEEAEIAEQETEWRRANNIETQGYAVPNEAFVADAYYQAQAAHQRALSAGVAASGGNVVDDELLAGSFIDILLENTVCTRLCTHLHDLEGDLIFPRQATRSQATWTGEIEAATEQDPTFDTVTMTPHHLRAYIVTSRQLIHQSSISIEQFIRRDLARAVAKAMDLAIMRGSGSGDEPEGIDNVTGINTVDWSLDGNSTSVDYDHFLEAEEKLADDDALMGRLAWVTEPTVRKLGRKTAELGTGTSRPIWYRNTVADYPASVTTQCADFNAYFANWTEFLIGHWGGVDILVNPFSLDTTAQVRIVIYKMVDFAVRHPVSFCRLS